MRAFIAIAACLVGCQVSEAGPPDDLAAKVERVRQRMHARFAASRTLEQAIVFGDLERARKEARTIRELVDPDVLPAWQPYLTGVRDAARQVELATSLVAAANTSAELGHRCAKCHEAAAGTLRFAKDPAPEPRGKLAMTMASHQWAASRMWEGLIGPAPERWLEGARALVRAPLAIVAEGDLPPELAVGDDVARLRLLARRAPDARTSDARAKLYGELLGTCVGCHATIRDR